MAGTKKKKKPAKNPARGFATTSIASKPRPDPVDAIETKPSNASQIKSSTPLSHHKNAPPITASQERRQNDEQSVSPEEFEKDLEESDLQLFVEKHAQKIKKDAQRQYSRLETDRRLLRGQAEMLNTQKWLPQEIVDDILDLIKAESRFSTSSLVSENLSAGKITSEDDIVTRLWTLQQTLAAAAFPEWRIQGVLHHILEIMPSVSLTSKDSIWGLEEALEWLALESTFEELPPYKKSIKPIPRDSSTNTPISSRPSTPRQGDAQSSRMVQGITLSLRKPNSQATVKKPPVIYDSEIEPERLVPEYVATRAKLLELRRVEPSGGSHNICDHYDDRSDSLEAYLEAKLNKIESDVLFDKHIANQEWNKERIAIERQLAAARKQTRTFDESQPQAESISTLAETEQISQEAERITAEILARNNEDNYEDITGLFDLLPQNEVDSSTGEQQTFINASNGLKIVIRDFGKWTGINPRRVLEEACRSRDPSVTILYTVISDVPFANRHAVEILWTKQQETIQPTTNSDLEIDLDPVHFRLTMARIACTETSQSESYAATAALFYIFNGNSKDEKVNLRLPSIWRDVWMEFADAKKNHSDTEDRQKVKYLRTMVRQRRDQELEDGVILPEAFRGRSGGRPSHDDVGSGIIGKPKHLGQSETLINMWANKAASGRYQSMLPYRMKLPMWSFKSDVLDFVDKNQAVIICGETGCGKSTQVPAFLLEHELSQGKPCKIYCTEPRRISAISLARRVSEELGESKGDMGTIKSLVGYSIRLEANTTKETRLVYATTGIVLRMLEGSNELQELTHLVLDEVHERSIDSDFLLIVLKRLLKRRKDLKIILMSATVDADRFSSYLDGAPILNVPGRTFPVEVRYIEDAVELTGYNLSGPNTDRYVDLDDDHLETDVDGPRADLAKSLSGYSARTRSVIAQIDEYRIDFDLIVQLMVRVATEENLQPYSKAVLVFLPGITEIRILNELLLGTPHFSKEWRIHPLHSTIATEDQEAAFLVPPPGLRKIVLATNIAETGITIPDVTCVIDCGKQREMRFDEKKQLSRLIDTFISRANAKQRRGRAGRVQNGICFHMFTKYRHENLLSDHQTPEMLRLSLQDLALRVKICKIGGIEEILGDALDPPSAKNIRRAVDALIDVRALTSAENLTPLGHRLARLPVDVFLGKLILLGTVFKCLDMAITVAAILSSKSPFSAPFGQRAQGNLARVAFRRANSDLLTTYNAYLAWKRVCQSSNGPAKEYQFCRKTFMSPQTLANIEDLKGQLLATLNESGFLSLTDAERRILLRFRGTFSARSRRQQEFVDIPQRVNLHSDNDVVSTSVISWSFYPKLLVRDILGSKGVRNIGNNQAISLHPLSVNHGLLDVKWLSYYNIMQTKSVYRAHETTAVDSFAIAILSGDVRCDLYSGVIILEGNRGRFTVSNWKTMLVIKALRTRLLELLARSFKQPGRLPTAQQEKWFEIWQRIFTQDFEKDKPSTISNISMA